MARVKTFLNCTGVFALGFLVMAVLLAAAPQKPPPPAPTLAITRNDGTTAGGRLVRANALEIVVQPLGAGHEPVRIPWNDVKHVSNGLTRQKAIDQQRNLHRDLVCAKCDGEGMILCSTCKGTGKDLSGRKDCAKCHGAGEITCTAANCKEGKVTCPGPCLKLSVGKWVKKDDGLLWRQFPSARGGSLEVSQRHLGTVIEIKNGVPTVGGQCPICLGLTTINCSICHGAGKVPCADCAKSDAPACAEHCDAGKMKCADCEGTGVRK